MFLKILTLLSLLTQVVKSLHHYEKVNQSKYTFDLEQPPYNINHYVSILNLQTCAFVAIGLKYFAIFVEEYASSNIITSDHKKFFLGVCHYDTLKEWTFCSTELYQINKHKCRLKLSGKRYQQRVQRRFCDMQVMIENTECMCVPTLFGGPMHKVVGFPTCYIPLLPFSLCKYNVCGLAKCNASVGENAVHTVHCDPNCKGRRPFCEFPVGSRTQSLPDITSSWTEWQEVASGTAAAAAPNGMKKYRSECRNNVTCAASANSENCTCRTSIENGKLIVERTEYHYNKNMTFNIPPILNQNYFGESSSHTTRHFNYNNWGPIQETRNNLRWKRESDAYDIEDEDDDDDNEDDTDDEIKLEENENNESTVSTTEGLEKDEAKSELQKEATEVVPGKKAFNVTEDLASKYTGIKCEFYILFVIFFHVI